MTFENYFCKSCDVEIRKDNNAFELHLIFHELVELNKTLLELKETIEDKE